MKMFLNAVTLLMLLTFGQMAHAAGSKQDSTKTPKKGVDTTAIENLDKTQKNREKQLKLEKHEKNEQSRAQKRENRRSRINGEMARKLKRKKEMEDKKYPPSKTQSTSNRPIQ